MSLIKITLPVGEIPVTGKQISFTAPCPCTEVEGLSIDGVTYTVCDALGKCITGVGGVWDKDSVVSVILNVDQKKAYIQNNSGYSPSNKPTAADVGAAPAGYGLGTVQVEAPKNEAGQSDANLITGTGFYRVITNTAFDGYGWSNLVHIQTSESSWIQLGWHAGRESLGYRIRRTTSSGIGAWEPVISTIGGVKKSGDTMTGALYIDKTNAIIKVKDAGGFAHGFYANKQGGTRLGGMCFSGDNEKLTSIHIGIGDGVSGDEYNSAKTLTITKDKLKFKNNDVLHAGNFSDYAVKKSGDTMTGDLTIGASGNHNTRIHSQGVGIRIVPEGGWARGYGAASSYDTSKSYGSFGFYGTDDSLGHLYIGWGANSYQEANCLAVSESKLKYKGKDVLHTGNLDTFNIGQIVTGSYVGTGTSGEANPNSLTFDRLPKWLVICDGSGNPVFNVSSNATMKYMGMTASLTTEYKTNAWMTVTTGTGFGPIGHAKCSDDRKTILWYVDGFDVGQSEQAVSAQCNSSGVTYRYFAIL